MNMNQMKYHLGHNQEKNHFYDHIPFNLKGNGNLFFRMHYKLKMSIKSCHSNPSILTNFPGYFNLFSRIFWLIFQGIFTHFPGHFDWSSELFWLKIILRLSLTSGTMSISQECNNSCSNLSLFFLFFISLCWTFLLQKLEKKMLEKEKWHVWAGHYNFRKLRHFHRYSSTIISHHLLVRIPKENEFFLYIAQTRYKENFSESG